MAFAGVHWKSAIPIAIDLIGVKVLAGLHASVLTTRTGIDDGVVADLLRSDVPINYPERRDLALPFLW